MRYFQSEDRSQSAFINSASPVKVDLHQKVWIASSPLALANMGTYGFTQFMLWDRLGWSWCPGREECPSRARGGVVSRFSALERRELELDCRTTRT